MSDLTERLNEVVQKAWANGWWKGRVQHDVAEAIERIAELEADRDSWRHTAGVNANSAGRAWGRINELETALRTEYMRGYHVGVNDGFNQ